MCYAKPGPRCSNHARKHLKKCQDVFESVAAEHNKVKKDTVLSPEEKQEELYRLRVAAVKAQDDISDATREYYSTPGGITELRESLNSCVDDDERRRIQNMIDSGVLRRSAQLKAYNDAKKAVKHSGNSFVTDVDENMSAEKIKEVLTRVPEGNVLPGKKMDEAHAAQIMSAQKRIQDRVDNLVGQFTTEYGDFFTPADLVEELGERDLIKGYKFLGAGAYRAAFLDKETGYVYKIPIDDRIRVDDQHSDSDFFASNEQKSYALLNFGDLEKHDVEYADTMFYRSKDFSTLPVIVQQYLPADEYEDADMSVEVKQSLLESTPLWDLNPFNMKKNKKTGKIVLFDCLPSGEGDYSYAREAYKL